MRKNRAVYYPQHRRTKRTALAICAVVSAFLCACQDRPATRRAFPKSAEVQRVTSPNGQFDAVLVTDFYGPAAGGGVDSNVYIVRKGSPAYDEQGREIFNADPMTGGQLVWKHDHLLEIHYDISYIHRFRNVWGLYEIENVGRTGERDYEVELRLCPASDSSALTSDGGFRHIGAH